MMDFCKQMKSMDEIERRPLFPSEKTNASAAAHSSVVPNIRKLRTREAVGTRYSSGAGMGTGAGTGTTGIVGGNGNVSAVKRHPSPVSTRAGSATSASMIGMPKRAQSAERRRSCTTTPPSRSSAPSSPTAKTPAASRGLSPSRGSATTTQGMHDSLVSAAARLQVSSQRSPEVLWPSMRSMSSSFQSEIISIPISKKESKTSSSLSSLNISTERERKRAPLPGRSTTSDHQENNNNTHHNHRPSAAVVDQHRWPRTTANGPKIAGTPTAFPSRVGFSPRIAAPINTGRSESERAQPLARSNRTMSLPSSPSKALSPTSASSSSRGMGSPFRTRPSTPFSPTSPSSSLSSISDNYRRLKKNPNHIEDAHQLRISHARYLQWRFVNAREEESSSFQKLTMEDELYSTWISITDLHSSVSSLKVHIQHLKLEMKLNSILENQMAYLHDYSLSENIHVNSLTSAIRALQASTMRLPLSGKITANTHTLKKTINSAIDVMESMGSSIYFLLSKVEDTNSVAFELANLAVEETYMLRECRELLVSTAAMQVQESTLRTHLLQLQNVGQRQL